MTEGTHIRVSHSTRARLYDPELRKRYYRQADRYDTVTADKMINYLLDLELKARGSDDRVD